MDQPSPEVASGGGGIVLFASCTDRGIVDGVTPEQQTCGPDLERVALTRVAERLTHEFEGRVEGNVVTSIVSQVNSDLGVQPAEARAELVERCARQRLNDAVAQK